MIPRECKRLAEVDFPIAEVSWHAVREKAIRHGLPSTLHLWWARRPLASCRAVLLGLLLPDPCDPACPREFQNAAVRHIKEFAAHVNVTKAGATRLVGDLRTYLRGKKEDKRRFAKAEARRRADAWRQIASTTEWNPACVRAALLQFLATGASWQFAHDDTFLAAARGLVEAAHPEEAPLVVDPFAGGGSIPLEALRVGCETFASDLNPVSCLILKVMLEDIPRNGPGLPDQVRRVGSEIRRKAAPHLTELYPVDKDGATPIAYLWARTVRCEAPNCGAEIPLIGSFWLCTKSKRKRALRHKVQRQHGRIPEVELEVFDPKIESEVPTRTVTRAKATCLCCKVVLPTRRVRAQLAEQRGGADVKFDAEGCRIGGARMTAVVTLRPGERGRYYRAPSSADYAAVRKAQERLAEILEQWEKGGRQGVCPMPDEPTPVGGGSGAGRAFSLQRYGMLQWADLFTARQKVALSRLVAETGLGMKDQPDASLLAIGKLVDLGNALCGWMPGQECPSAVFKLGRVKMGWDFVEGCVLSGSSGSLEKCTHNLAAGVVSTHLVGSGIGHAIQAEAQRSPVPHGAAALYFTDPPYYDAIPYADLADFFLVWMKRAVPDHPLLRDTFDPSNPLSPKNQEAVQDDTRLVDGRPKDAAFFDSVMEQAFGEGRRILSDDGVGAVVFAHKTTEGWEAFLSGMIGGGWTITASWPIATEMAHRIRARESAALATSVHLICRPRPDDAPVGEWADVLRKLPGRVREWIERLESEGVRGADLVFACVGPALEIFSRYTRVETPDGTVVGLPEYLERVWEVVGRTALEEVLGTADAQARNGHAGVLEEDARLTALFLWALQSTQSTEADEGESVTKFSLPFDVVRRFAQPMGIDLDAWTDRIIGQQKGIVQLLPVAKRAKQLLGEDAGQVAADWFEGDLAATQQQTLFPDLVAEPGFQIRRRSRALLTDDAGLASPSATTLDRVHAAMLYQARGVTYALGSLIQAEKDRGPQFLRLANALSALYPRGSEEKRLLDAMLVAIPNR